jgi:lipid-A-disaccharide synthase
MSGDLLGAGVMRAIKARHPSAEFVGIGGAGMVAEGLDTLFPMDRLAVMGVVEVLKRLRELLAIRRRVLEVFLEKRVDLFIGIDSPDFNLPVAGRLRASGVKTAHYVSPTVWAWRQKRVVSIAESIDMMLVLFPFEEDFYRTHDVPVRFVGHPLAHRIDMNIDHAQVKRHWGFDAASRVVAVLPGSRGGELKHMGPLFIDTMRQLAALDPRIRFIVPFANPDRRRQFERQWAQSGVDIPYTAVEGHAREVMAGADLVLATSGTVTLEAMLLKRPMVVAYRWGSVTHAIISRMVKTPWIALPNILAGEALVPEFVQSEATSDRLTRAVLQLFEDASVPDRLRTRFDAIHASLRRDADTEAADALLGLLPGDLAEWREARHAAGI